MKTFDEALELIVRPRGSAPDGQIMEEMVEKLRRYEGIQKEVKLNPGVVEFCEVVLNACAENDLGVFQALMLCFSHGVIVGCEMEKTTK